jgi:general secretion pathway protein C
MFPGSALIKKYEDELILSVTGFIVLAAVAFIVLIMTDVFTFKSDLDNQTSSQPDQNVSSTGKSKPSTQQPSRLAQQIARLDIFSGPATPPSRNLKKTRLSLSLNGIINADNPESSVAIIAGDRNQPESAYKVGDSLPGGAVLKEVHLDHVVLLNRGSKESLFLSHESLKPAEAQFNQTRPNDEELERAILRKMELRNK